MYLNLDIKGATAAVNQGVWCLQVKWAAVTGWTGWIVKFTLFYKLVLVTSLHKLVLACGVGISVIFSLLQTLKPYLTDFKPDIE